MKKIVAAVIVIIFTILLINIPRTEHKTIIKAQVVRRAVIHDYITVNGRVGEIDELGELRSKINASEIISAANIKRDTGRVTVKIPENLIDKVKVGQPAQIYGSAFDDRVYSGTVEKISDAAYGSGSLLGGDSISVDAVIKVKNPDKRFIYGLSTVCRIKIKTYRNIIALPYESIYQDKENKEYVLVYENKKIVPKEIKVGEEFEELAQVVRGLKEGDIVVTR